VSPEVAAAYQSAEDAIHHLIQLTYGDDAGGTLTGWVVAANYTDFTENGMRASSVHYGASLSTDLVMAHGLYSAGDAWSTDILINGGASSRGEE
jgi:hypothetical protein